MMAQEVLPQRLRLCVSFVNTLNAALGNMSNVVRIRHKSGAKQRLENAHKVMGLANQLSVRLEGIFNQWTKVHICDEEVKKLIQLALCPNKETLDALKKVQTMNCQPCLKIRWKVPLPTQ